MRICIVWMLAIFLALNILPARAASQADKIEAQTFEKFEESLRKISQSASYAAFNRFSNNISILQFDRQNFPLPAEPPLQAISRLEEQLARLERGDVIGQVANAFKAEHVSQSDKKFLAEIFSTYGSVLKGKSLQEVNALSEARVADLRKQLEEKRKAAQQRAGQSQVLTNQQQSTDQTSSPAISVCAIPKVDPAVAVEVIGVYEGKNPAAVEFQNESHVTGHIDVLVPKAKRKIFLVLSAYDPVVWNLAVEDKSKIAGVLAIGYHPQGVANLPKGVPIFFVTYTDGGQTGCGRWPGTAYDGGPQLVKFDGYLKGVLGKSLDHFEGGYSGARFAVGLPAGTPFPAHLAVKDVTPENVVSLRPVSKLDLPGGDAGLQKLIRDGAIRPATKLDMDAWIEKASAPYQKMTPGYRVKTRMMVGRTYVVLKETKLPRGLFGAHSASFLVPVDVPKPDLPQSHSTLYYVSDGSCTGVGCSGD